MEYIHIYIFIYIYIYIHIYIFIYIYIYIYKYNLDKRQTANCKEGTNLSLRLKGVISKTIHTKFTNSQKRCVLFKKKMRDDMAIKTVVIDYNESLIR